MKKKYPPVMNPDNNDLNNDLFEAVGYSDPKLGIEYQPVKGILLLVSALLFFSSMDTTVKYLTMQYNTPLVVAIRYIVHCLLMVIIFAPTMGRGLVRTKRTGLVVLRGACLMIASLAVASALRLMPVAEMTATVFVAPMLVVLLAKPILGEKIGILGWTAAILGFAGVLLIVRPGGGIDLTAVFYMVFAVICNAFYQILSRVLTNTEGTIVMLFYTALIGAVCFGLALPWYWEGESPDFVTVLLFLNIGASGGIGHLLYTQAFRHAPASMLAPINYLQLIWAGLLGWIIFDHIPDGWSIVGMLIVASSGGLIALKSVEESTGILHKLKSRVLGYFRA